MTRRGAGRQRTARRRPRLDPPAPGPQHQQRRHGDRQLPHGAVLAYVGSANFFGESTPQHQPNFDVIGQAYRQSGSAFKPITYAAGFESRRHHAGHACSWTSQGEIVDGYAVPNADNRERGPVRVRDALKYSLNIPVTKAQQLDRHRQGRRPWRAAGARLGSAAGGRGRRAVAHAGHDRRAHARPRRAPTVAIANGGEFVPRT